MDAAFCSSIKPVFYVFANYRFIVIYSSLSRRIGGCFKTNRAKDDDGIDRCEHNSLHIHVNMHSKRETPVSENRLPQREHRPHQPLSRVLPLWMSVLSFRCVFRVVSARTSLSARRESMCLCAAGQLVREGINPLIFSPRFFVHQSGVPSISSSTSGSVASPRGKKRKLGPLQVTIILFRVLMFLLSSRLICV